LSDVIDNYERGKSFKYNRQLADAKKYWKLFVECVGVENIDDIDTTHLQRFNKAVGKFTEARTRKNVVMTVQSILKYAGDIFKNHRPIIANLKIEIRRICKWGKLKKSNPRPWKIPDYHAMLAECEKDKDPMWYAILIASLNLGLHPGEMADLLIAEFDLVELTFTSNRTKTGESRVATVWQRTADAIRAYMATDHFKQNKSPLLFTTTQPDRQGRVNQPFKIWKINTKIRRLRKNAKLGDDVVFDGIRDLFRTSAGATNAIAIRWAMGHAGGQDDLYSFRDPAETAEMMAKVEQKVFGQTERQRGQSKQKPRRKAS